MTIVRCLQADEAAAADGGALDDDIGVAVEFEGDEDDDEADEVDEITVSFPVTVCGILLDHTTNGVTNKPSTGCHSGI